MSKSLDEMFDHPCKQTCSGWKQGFEKGSRQTNMEISNIEDKLYHTSRKIDELNYELGHEIKVLKARLEIAADALKFYSVATHAILKDKDKETLDGGLYLQVGKRARQALKQITEVEG
jgi:hypothetical protein